MILFQGISVPPKKLAVNAVSPVDIAPPKTPTPTGPPLTPSPRPGSAVTPLSRPSSAHYTPELRSSPGMATLTPVNGYGQRRVPTPGGYLDDNGTIFIKCVIYIFYII